MDKILITGVTGLLGPYLIEHFENYFDVITTGLSGGDYSCDLTKQNDVKNIIKHVKPNIIINLSGFTDVDGCEKNTALAMRLNADISQNILNVIDPETYYIYISTDQVYPDINGLHIEEKYAPVNSYGLSKMKGESYVKKHRSHLIVRTNFFGKSKTKKRSSLSDFIINSFEKKEPFRLFSDIKFSPVHMSTLSDVLLKCINSSVFGTYNLGSRNGMSKSDFGLEIAKLKKLDTNNVSVVSSDSLPNRAPRTKDLRMSVAKIEQALKIEMPTLKLEIEKI